MTLHPCGNSAPFKNYELQGEYDLHKQPFIQCAWHRLAGRLSKRLQKVCRLDVNICFEEATETVWTIEEDYPVCALHQKIWEGISDDEA